MVAYRWSVMMKPEIGTADWNLRIAYLKKEIETLMDEKDFDGAAWMQIYLLKVVSGEK